ncbi:hypothetical protein AGMMS49975_21540 [Clostridia bacterium]|nr:hypothetical protein AGMMS49975_21540 [Clostridia bacterium]
MNVQTEIFLADTNIFIEPFKTFYPTDFAPQYWSFLEYELKNGTIKLLDKVRAEVKAKGLKEWLVGVKGVAVIKSGDNSILENLGNILDHLQNAGLYTDNALTEWSKNEVADPWIIATAMAKDYTVVTLEQPNRNLGKGGLIKEAKVPDVCKHFDVPYIDLYTMLRRLKFTFG